MKKSLISDLLEVKNNLSFYEDEDFAKIYNLCNDYMNETQDRKLEECFEGYNDARCIGEYIKSQAEKQSFSTLKNIISGVDYDADWFRIDVYWYIQNIDKSDIECLVDELVDRLQD